MKRMSMTSRDRRALLLGVIITIPALLIPFGLKPYLQTLSAYRQETANEQARLEREQALVANLPTLPATHRAAVQQLEREARRLFQGNTDLVATSDLAQYVASVAQTSGIQLQTETRPARVVLPDLQALQLQVRAEGDLDGVLHFLHQLETGDKLVRVGDVSIDAGAMPNPNSAKGVEVLSVSASVYGYRLGGAHWRSIQTRDDSAPPPFVAQTRTTASLDAVLDHDLFNVARTRPAISYRRAMRGEVTPLPQKLPPPHFHLVGTVSSTHDANFAMIQQDGAHGTAPQVISPGERVDNYILRAVHRGVAVFTAPDGTRLELQADAQSDVFLTPLSIHPPDGVSIRIEKDSTGKLQIVQSPGGGGSMMFDGPQGDTVYAQVDGPAGWGGDTGRFLLSTDGKGNCCRQVPMTMPGTYVYQIWDGGSSLIGKGTITMEQQ